MAFEFATGTLLVNTGVATTTYTVTGKTGTWKAVILFWSGRPETTDAGGEGDVCHGFGAAVSSTSRWAYASVIDHGPTTVVTDRYHANTGCVIQLAVNGALVGLADFSAFTADGFTLVIDDAFPTAMEIGYVLLGGSDLTNVATGFVDLSASTGDVDHTGVGFQPDFILAGGVGIAADPDGGTTNNLISIGAATSSAQAVMSVYSADNLGNAICSSYCRAGEIHATQATNNTTVFVRCSFTSFLADGFKINNLEAPGSRRLFYLALKGGTYTIGDFLTATDTNAFTEAHGMAVTPKGALFLSSNRAASTQDAATAHAEWSVGASDGTVNVCHYYRDKDAASTGDCFNAVSHDQCYLNADNGSGQALEGEGHVNSFDATNINLQMTDADPVQSFVWYAAFGNTPAGGISIPIVYHHRQQNI
jgi:hypothetical protein